MNTIARMLRQSSTLGCSWLVSIAVVCCSLPHVAGAAESEKAAARIATEAADDESVAPVVLDGATLMRVRGISAFPASNRAARIAARIQALAADRSFSPTMLRIEEADGMSRILARDEMVLAVTDADAHLERLDRPLVARVYAERIGAAIDAYRRDRSPEHLLHGGLFALLATVALVAVIWGGGRTMRRIDEGLARRVSGQLAGLEAKSLRVLRTASLRRALRGVRSLLWTIAVLLAIVFYLNFVLALFPWTRSIGARLFDLVVDPLRVIGQGLLASIPDLVFLAILVVVTRYVLQAIRLLFAGIDQGTLTPAGFQREWAWPTYRLVRLLVVVFAVVVAYPYIPGSESNAFKGISVFLGVIFSLGSSSLIGNIIAGYSMIYRRTFQKGDRVLIDNQVGDVVETGLFVTRVRTVKNEEIVIPNSVILNNSVVNYSTLARAGQLILHTTVGIGYETPWRQVEAMLLEAAARTEGFAADPAPFVLEKALGDFCVTYEINAYCADAQAMGRLYARLHQNILDVFNEYGVQIMTPAYEGDPETPKLVPKSDWYAAPASPPVNPTVAPSRDGSSAGATPTPLDSGSRSG